MRLLEVSLIGGVLIVVITAVRALALHKLPKFAFLALWTAALLRLLLPFELSSPVSAYTAVVTMAPHARSAGAPPSTWNTPLIETIAQMQASSAVTPQGMPGAGGFPAAAVIWLAGAAVLFAFFAASYLRGRKMLADAVPIEASPYLASWLAQNRLKRPLRVLQSDRISGPVSAGILHPRIILPSTMNFADHRQMDYVLTHEMLHLRRFDTLWKAALIAAACVHWFNPLVWLMYVLASRDLEISCDERVIRKFGLDNRRTYALSLIDMVSERHPPSTLYNCFCKTAAEERIVSIMKCKKISLSGMLVALLLITMVPCIFALDARLSLAEAVYTTYTNQSGTLSIDYPTGWVELSRATAEDLAEKIASGEVSAIGAGWFERDKELVELRDSVMFYSPEGVKIEVIYPGYSEAGVAEYGAELTTELLYTDLVLVELEIQLEASEDAFLTVVAERSIITLGDNAFVRADMTYKNGGNLYYMAQLYCVANNNVALIAVRIPEYDLADMDALGAIIDHVAASLRIE